MGNNNTFDELDELGEALGVAGDGDKGALDKSSVAGAFSTPQSSDPLRALLTPGSSLVKLAMKGNVPSRQFAVALSSLYRKYRAKDYDVGCEQLLVLLGALCGVEAKRAGLVVDGIVGERRNARQSMGERFKSWVDGIGGNNGS